MEYICLGFYLLNIIRWYTINRIDVYIHRTFIVNLCFFILVVTDAAEYHGKYLGPLKSYHHGLGGDVYAVDARTLHIRNFVYDGEGPGDNKSL